MTTPQPPQTERSYGCTFGCGNPYDYILISVVDGEVEFLCLPDYVRLAMDMVAAVTNPDDPNVATAVAAMNGLELQQPPGPRGKRRGHNAPVTAADDDVLTDYDDRITADDLPDEFK